MVGIQSLQRIYETQHPKKQIIQLRNGQKTWIDTFPKKTSIWVTDLKRCSKSLIIKEIQIKTPNKIITSHLPEWIQRSYFTQISKGEIDHGRLWTLRNKLRVMEGRGVGGWVSLVLGIKEGTYCMEYWVWCINNEFWNTHTKEIKFLKNCTNFC